MPENKIQLRGVITPSEASSRGTGHHHDTTRPPTTDLPSMTSLITLTAHQPNPTVLQPQQSHHQLRFREPHASVTMSASWLVSTLKPSSLQRGDVGTPHMCRNSPFHTTPPNLTCSNLYVHGSLSNFMV